MTAVEEQTQRYPSLLCWNPKLLLACKCHSEINLHNHFKTSKIMFASHIKISCKASLFKKTIKVITINREEQLKGNNSSQS